MSDSLGSLNEELPKRKFSGDEEVKEAKPGPLKYKVKLSL
jgi:hypothetical protein